MKSQNFGPWRLVILVLSVIVLVALMAETFLHLDGETIRILQQSDTFICFVFLADFCIRFSRAPSKRQFMRWGWIDLISSIPMLDFLRWGRLVRVIRILRVLRGVRSAKVIISFIFENRAKGTMAAAALICVIIALSGSVAVLEMERDADGSNIKSAGDATWWAVTTMTTVGYGDRFPVSTEGRIVGALLMVCGVGLFGVLSGFIATWFIEGNKDDRHWTTLEEIKADLEEIKKRLPDHSPSPGADCNVGAARPQTAATAKLSFQRLG